MSSGLPLFIPVVLGTARRGRYSENVASFVLEQMRLRRDVETELIDIRDLPLPPDDAGEALKQRRHRPDSGMSHQKPSLSPLLRLLLDCCAELVYALV